MVRFLLLFIVASSFAVANDFVENISLKALSMQILAEKPDAVHFCTADKMYLKSDKIFPTAAGLFLGDSSCSLPLPLVFADSSGCYLPCASGSSQENTGYWCCLECGILWHSLKAPSLCPNGHHRSKIIPGNI